MRVKITRRNFLKLLLASGAGTLAGCVMRNRNLWQSPIPRHNDLIKNIISSFRRITLSTACLPGFPARTGSSPVRRVPIPCRTTRLTTTPIPFKLTELQLPQRGVLMKKLTLPITGNSRAPLPYATTTSVTCADPPTKLPDDDLGTTHETLDAGENAAVVVPGHRVPCIVISPYAHAGYVSHALHSHVSLLHFADTIFGLEPLTHRDADASDMLDCFDFDQVPAAPLNLETRICP